MRAYLCCMNCFNDIYLKKFIQDNGELADKCDFCSSEQSICLEPSSLLEKFEFLIGSFEEDNNGNPLSTLLNDTYAIFHKNINKTELLLQKILGETYQKKKYKPRFDTSYYANQWNEFKEEIKHENRFFPVNSIYSSIFNIEKKESIFFNLLSQLTKKISKEQIFYRARVSENKLKAKNMGAPPKGTSSAGRANPIGISYLYLANNLDTCISEVRPSNASSIYVSECNISNGNINILDLTNPKKDTSIMAFEANALGLVSSYLELLEILSSELSKPILPNNSIIDYIPTQLLCEFIKSVGKFDGIAFNSSFNHGTNYVFYDPNKFTINHPKKYKINAISYNFDVINA